MLIGVRSSFQHLIEATGCALEFLQFLGWDLLLWSFPDRLHQVRDPFAHVAIRTLVVPTIHGYLHEGNLDGIRGTWRRGGNQRLSSGDTQCGERRVKHPGSGHLPREI